MCRSCDEGGRRCPKTPATKAAERAASKRYYQRSKARAQIADLAAHGIPAMDDLDCPTTYHLGEDLDLSAPPDREDSGMNKPPGLWASPGREGGGGVMTDWSDRSVIESGSAPRGQRLFSITPQPGAVVIRLDSAEDIAAFGRAFDFSGESHAEKLEAWRRVSASGVDGVMLTSRGVSAAKGLRYGTSREEDRQAWLAGDTLENWDTSSVVWLRNDHLEAGEAQQGTYPAHEITPEEQEEIEQGWGQYLPTHDLDPMDGPRTYDEGRPTRVKTGTDTGSLPDLANSSRDTAFRRQRA